ncbi:metallophosphoesterase family protein [Variovorax saccharolyticus]|uniref:metallophosphoesterase family protein n=1 Tax=Variovorax saccharolyticus TaxID=3053516 RepID=UPI002577B634|nr:MULTISPECIES: metallophosphoesterase [unclassified Variovorax]MDM0022887.1 metallophosphoesterase [Variovorax sp. J22R187]MDM0029663.1 metallophosphoesterase [Variovorax sp. J31P216]
MTVLLQISDPHFGTEQEPVVRALELLARTQRPDLVVLSGDITQRATRAQFRLARAFVDRLAAPSLLAIPGNHDIPLFALGTRLLNPYGRYREAFGSTLEPMFESVDCLVLGVNTTRWYRHKNGEVSASQVERVARRLALATPQQLRVVVVHQPVAVTLPEDASNRLLGRDVAVARWSAANADLVLGGHIHLPFVRSLPQELPSSHRRMWAVQAGTAVSTRLRRGAPNSVNLIRWSGGLPRSCVVERWDCVAGTARFDLAATDTLPLGEKLPFEHGS